MSKHNKKTDFTQKDLDQYGVWLDESDDPEVPTLHEVLEEAPETPFSEELNVNVPDIEQIEDTIHTAENDPSINLINVSVNPSDDGSDSSADQLQKEIAELRNEITELKVMVASLSTQQRIMDASSDADQGGFFEYDVANDETIALSDNELDNIFKTSEIFESEGIASSAEEAADLFNKSVDASLGEDALGTLESNAETTDTTAGFFNEPADDAESIVVDDLDLIISEENTTEASLEDSDLLNEIPLTEPSSEMVDEDGPLLQTDDLAISETTQLDDIVDTGIADEDSDLEEEYLSDISSLDDADLSQDSEDILSADALQSDSSFDLDSDDFAEIEPFSDDDFDAGSTDIDALDIEFADEISSPPSQKIDEELRKPLIDVISLVEDMSKKNPDFQTSISSEKKESLEYLISLLQK